MYYTLNYEEAPATMQERFLALDCSEVTGATIGATVLYRGIAQRSVGPIQKGDAVDLTMKQHALYQEYVINENSPI